jgi:hypothetical protein
VQLHSFFNLGARREGGWWSMPRPGNDPLPITQEAGWAPGPVWTGVENIVTPTGIRSPDRLARSELLYTNYALQAQTKYIGYNSEQKTPKIPGGPHHPGGSLLLHWRVTNYSARREGNAYTIHSTSLLTHSNQVRTNAYSGNY